MIEAQFPDFKPKLPFWGAICHILGHFALSKANFAYFFWSLWPFWGQFAQCVCCVYTNRCKSKATETHLCLSVAAASNLLCLHRTWGEGGWRGKRRQKNRSSNRQLYDLFQKKMQREKNRENAWKNMRYVGKNQKICAKIWKICAKYAQICANMRKNGKKQNMRKICGNMRKYAQRIYSPPAHTLRGVGWGALVLRNKPKFAFRRLQRL